MKIRNIPGVAYSQRRYSNTVATNAANYQSDPSGGSLPRYLVSVTAWNAQGGNYGSVQVEVISAPSNSAATVKEDAYYNIFNNEKGPTSNNTTTGGLESYPIGTPGYLKGTVLRLKAVTASNGKFVGWEDGVASATRTVTVTGNASYVARFISKVQSQNLRLLCLDSRGRIQGEGLTEETANNAGVLKRVYTANVNNGDSITFKAVAKEGYHFVRWDVIAGRGVVSGVNLNTAKITLRMTGSASLEAIFDVDQQDPNDNPGDNQGGKEDLPYNGNDDPPYNIEERDPEEPPTPTPGGGETPGNGGGNTPVVPGAGIVETAKPFVRKWWWAILIVAYIVYKEWKGGSK